MRPVIKLVLGASLIPLMFVRCAPGDFEGDLPYGYKIWKTSTVSIIIEPLDQSPRFKGFITGVDLQKNYIVGEVDKLPPSLSQIPNSAPAGYFIIDMKSETIEAGLERQDWLAKLAARGISEEPILRRPSAYGTEPFSLTMLRAMVIVMALVFLATK